MAKMKQGAPNLSNNRRKQVSFRKAGIEDINALINITKACFPDQIRWQLQALSRKYWEGALNSSNSKIWIWTVDGEKAGFTQILLDIDGWIKEKKAYDYKLFTKIYSMFLKPKLVIGKLKERIKEKNLENLYLPPRNICESEAILGRIAPTRHTGSTFYGGITVDPEKVMWFELAGVLPGCRKYGIAMLSLQQAEKLARETGKQAICGVIKSSIKSWCLLHERFGYSVVASNKGRFTFVKSL
jgi:hypothetical protein